MVCPQLSMVRGTDGSDRSLHTSREKEETDVG